MNKPFLKSIALLFAMIMISLPSWAQDAGSMPTRADLEKRIEDTVNDLGLSEEQATQFRAIENQFIDDRKSKMDSATDHDKARKEVREMSRAKMEKMKALLTPEQFKVYKNLRPKRDGHKKGKRSRPEPGDDGNNRK